MRESRWRRPRHAICATNTATVTVNDQFTVRHGNALWCEVLSTNGAGPAWLGVTNRAVLRNGGNADITNTVTGGPLVPKASESSHIKLPPSE